jgi:predicted dehydrogenase
MDRLGWAVIGIGVVSRSLVADLALLAEARPVAVASRDADRASRFAAEVGFERAYGAVDALLEDEDVEVVYIGTPHSTHSPLAIRCLEAGKHVLVEKPMAVDAAEARRIVAAAAASRCFAMEGMWMRFNPVYRSLLREIADGVIGAPVALRASFGLPFGNRDSPSWSAESRSSTLLDQGIYPVTFARDLFGDPLSVCGAGDVRDDGVDLTVHATLEYSSGRFAQVAASMVTFLEPTASVSGTQGWLTAAAPFWAMSRYSRHAGDLGAALFSPEEVSLPVEGNGYVPMLREMNRAIAEGKTEHPWHPLADTVAVLEILDRIRSSVDRGSKV